MTPPSDEVRDLDTAAREVAEAYVDGMTNAEGKYYAYRVGFTAGAAHMQKRIEELERRLVGERGQCERDVSKEREISKMLERALSLVVTGEYFEMSNETLTEVAKLRGDSTP